MKAKEFLKSLGLPPNSIGYMFVYRMLVSGKIDIPRNISGRYVYSMASKYERELIKRAWLARKSRRGHKAGRGGKRGLAEKSKKTRKRDVRLPSAFSFRGEISVLRDSHGIRRILIRRIPGLS